MRLLRFAAVALLLERAGVRTTLLCRTEEQTRALTEARENKRYLPGVELPAALKVRTFGAHQDQFRRPDLVFLAVPSKGLGEAIAEIERLGVSSHAGMVSLAKGLVPPDGTPPTAALERAFGPERTACVGGPAHAREMIETGAGLVCASHSEALAIRVSELFQRAGVVCEASNDPVGVELAGVAKNRANAWASIIDEDAWYYGATARKTHTEHYGIDLSNSTLLSTGFGEFLLQ